MEGHLFIIDGDLTKLSCDAWLLPTDGGFFVESWCAELVGLAREGILEAQPWAEGERFRPFTEEPPESNPWVWLGNVGRDERWSADWFASQAGEFVKQASHRIESLKVARPPKSGGLLPLLAVNALGSGKGGKASEKGALFEALIPRLRSSAEQCCVDVVLVTKGRAAYSAAQRVRRKLVNSDDAKWAIDETWRLGPNAPNLQPIAEDLAQAVQRDNLVLFFGAGVSIDAGIPPWQALLDEIARDAGLGGQLDQLRNLDLRDQAAIVGRRLEKDGRSLGQLVATHTSATKYSLAHGLLASLGVREAVTTNYDNLFEAAVGNRDGGLAVLPGNAVKPSQRWLLKLHGSIEDENNIVLTRDDYLGIATRRGALIGLVQAMLMTRKMLFVGYSLTDEDFHSLISDVRMAVPPGQNLGVVITLLHNDFFEELWHRDIRVTPMLTSSSEPSEADNAVAARLVLVFLDLVGFVAADLDAFMLKPDYESMLTDDEKLLAAALEQLSHSVSSLEDAPGLRRVHSLLSEFGLEGGE